MRGRAGSYLQEVHAPKSSRFRGSGARTRPVGAPLPHYSVTRTLTYNLGVSSTEHYFFTKIFEEIQKVKKKKTIHAVSFFQHVLYISES